MAIGENLRYYRRQYSPGSTYEDDYREPGVISMYNPEGMGRLIEATGRHQERFDIARSAESAEIARIGELETYDLSELNKRLQSFEGGINTLVKEKYNGDYAAAANEIAKMIGTERTNPFYHFNKQKVEMGKAYLDAKMKLGANFLSAGNPLSVSFKDWQQGKTFEFTPVDARDITQRSAAVFQSFAKKVMSDSGLKLSPEGQYFVNTVRTGFRDENEAIDFAERSGLLDQIYDSMPELTGIDNQDAVLDAIKQGAIAGIGTTETKYLANQGYLDALQQARLAGTSGGGIGKITQAGYLEVPGGRRDKLSSPLWSSARDMLAQTEARKEGVDVKTFEELDAMTGPQARQITRNVRDRLKKEFTDSKTAYMLITPLSGTTSQAGIEYDRNVKQLNVYVNNSLQRGDLIGVEKEDGRNLEGLTDIEVKGYSMIPSVNPNNPYIIRLLVSGTPESKGAGKAKPIEVDAVLNPDSIDDNVNIFEYLTRLDQRVAHTLVRDLFSLGNVDRAKELMEYYGTTASSPTFQ